MAILNYTDASIGTSIGVTPKSPLPVRFGGPNTSMFGEVLSVQRTPVIELKSIYGPSALRDITTTANGGAVALASGEITLTTGTTANGTAQIDSAERGRYLPGFGGEVGVGVRIPTAATGNHVAEWGLRSGNEGIYFGQDASGIFAARISGGTETKVRQADWNIDALDGKGPSGVTLDVSNGIIFQIQFSWYGYGQILYGIAAILSGKQTFIPCHSLQVIDGLSILTPNLPIYAKADNGGDASSYVVALGGRQYSIIGKYRPRIRFVGQNRGSVATSTTAVPLVTFRSKTGFENRSVKINGYEVKPVAEDCIIEVRLNGTLTGASYVTPTNHTAAETSQETDISATAISGGNVLWTEYVLAGTIGRGVFTAREGIDLDIPENQLITLCARTVSGTGTIFSNFRLAEEW